MLATTTFSVQNINAENSVGYAEISIGFAENIIGFAKNSALFSANPTLIFSLLSDDDASIMFFFASVSKKTHDVVDEGIH